MRNQAFRYGPCAYGVQYHIEVTPQILATWLDLYRDEVSPEMVDSWLHHSASHTSGGDANDTATTDKKQQSHFPIYHAHTRKMLENFLSISELINLEIS